MSLVALDHSAELGGAELSLWRMARELGNELQVILLESGPLVEILIEDGCLPAILDLNGRFEAHLRDGPPALASLPSIVSVILELRRGLLRILDERCSRVVIVNTLRSAMMIAMAALPDRIRCIVMLQDSISEPNFTRTRALLARHAINRSASAIVANSAWTLRQLRTARPSFVIPPFMDRELFDAPVFLRPSIPTARRVLMLGRIARWKGQLFGLESVVQLPKSACSTLTIAGAPWFKEQKYYQDLANRVRDIAEIDVRLLGHVRNVRNLIDTHDIVLHTSLLAEPFGQVVVEGMARAKLVIAPNLGGPGEIVTDGFNGFLYKTGNRESLIVALDKAIHVSREEATQMGLAARRTAEIYHPRLSAERLKLITSTL